MVYERSVNFRRMDSIYNPVWIAAASAARMNPEALTFCILKLARFLYATPYPFVVLSERLSSISLGDLPWRKAMHFI